MNLSGVRDGKSFGDSLIASCIDASVLELKCHFEIGKRIPQLVRLSEVTRKIVVGCRAHSIVLLSEKFCLLQ